MSIRLVPYQLKEPISVPVEDEDYDWIKQYDWFHFYGYAATKIDGKIYLMHQMIADRHAADRT